jgi:hypothetical protein
MILPAESYLVFLVDQTETEKHDSRKGAKAAKVRRAKSEEIFFAYLASWRDNIFCYCGQKYLVRQSILIRFFKR